MTVGNFCHSIIVHQPVQVESSVIPLTKFGQCEKDGQVHILVDIQGRLLKQIEYEFLVTG